MAEKKTTREPNIYQVIYLQQGSQKDIKLGDECNHAGTLFTVGRIRITKPGEIAVYAQKTDKLLRYIYFTEGNLLRIDYL